MRKQKSMYFFIFAKKIKKNKKYKTGVYVHTNSGGLAIWRMFAWLIHHQRKSVSDVDDRQKGALMQSIFAYNKPKLM